MIHILSHDNISFVCNTNRVLTESTLIASTICFGDITIICIGR
jgi:hypothetical protein